MSTTSTFAAAALAAAGTATSRSEARPLDRAPWARPANLPADTIAFPDALGANGSGATVNISDGTIGSETAGHIAFTESGIRKETTITAEDYLAMVREVEVAAGLPASWKLPEDGDKKRSNGVVIRAIQKHGIPRALTRVLPEAGPATAGMTAAMLALAERIAARH